MKHLRHRSMQELWPYAAMALLTILALLPGFAVDVNTSDDFQYYNTARRPFAYWLADHQWYANTGRFYFLVTKYFYYVPYLLDNFAAAKAIQYVTLAAAYLLFAILVGRALRSRQVALLTMLVLVINTSVANPSQHIATTCYPFYFSFSLIIFLLACLLYLRHFRQWSEGGSVGRWRPWVASVLMFVSFLFYETYLIFAFLVGIALVAGHWRRSGARQMLRDRHFYADTLPLLLAAVLYVAIYFAYRLHLSATGQTLYDGTSFNPDTFSLANFFRIIWRCTLAAFPGQSYFWNKGLVADHSMLLQGHHNSPLFIITHASAATLVCGLLAVLLVWRATRRGATPGWRKLAVASAVGIAIAFLTHTLIALSEKYNVEWAAWIRGYVTTLYSYLGVALVLAVAIVASLKAVRPTALRNALRVLWCVLVAFFTILTGYSNEHFARALAVNHNRIEAINLLGSSGYLSSLPEGSVLFTDALHDITPLARDITRGTRDIEGLIGIRSGERVRCTPDVAEANALHRQSPDAPLFVVGATATRRAGELMMVVAQLADTLPTQPQLARASHADVFYLSPEKQYTVVYTDATGTHCLAADHPKRDRLTHTSLDAPGIDPWSVMISNMYPTNKQWE